MTEIPKPVSNRVEPAHNILPPPTHPLDLFFAPKSVAVIGATEKQGSVGRTLMWNLVTNPFGETVYPVNANRASVLGIKAYPSVSVLPEIPELAVISTPSRTIPGIVRECADRGIRGAIVISAGFKELGPEGLALEQQLLDEARRGGMRIVGPNCLGIMNPLSHFNATFARGIALPGRVAFISQSGALCTAVLDWSHKERVGFSGFVSIGSMSDVGWGDLIDYFGQDPNTDSILIYMESVGDARSFLSAAREVALTKPVIAIKVGRKPVDTDALEQLMVRFSQLVIEQPWIKELDINPLLASPDHLVALDARVVIYGPEVDVAGIPRPAIAPYPTRHVGEWTSKSGNAFTIRPIRPEDELGLINFHERLSEHTVYRRYREALEFGTRTAHERLTRICFIDYGRAATLVAEAHGPSGRRIEGVGRLVRQPGNSAELSIVLTDEVQAQGLGTEILQRLIPMGKELGFARISADLLPENAVMKQLLEKAGFTVRESEGLLHAEKPIL